MSFSTLFSIGSLLKVFLSLSTNNGKAKGLGVFVSFISSFNFFNLSNDLVILLFSNWYSFTS